MAGRTNKSVLFVCLGNICRSPIAEAIFRHIVIENKAQDQWDIDSAATSDYHTGKAPDQRARAVMKKHGITMIHRARQLCAEDFNRFQYILGMDSDNIDDILGMAPSSYSAKVELLGNYNPGKSIMIQDPYYDEGEEGFEKVYNECVKCCQRFFEHAQK